jgi:hypothetical protein
MYRHTRMSMHFEHYEVHSISALKAVRWRCCCMMSFSSSDAVMVIHTMYWKFPKVVPCSWLCVAVSITGGKFCVE